MKQITGEWLTHKGTQAICALLEDAGFQAFLVGGCVRNALLGVQVADVDVATDARPGDIEKTVASAGFKSIPTGKDHGTITVLAHGQSFEVTTFRKDIKTDGRHAVVAFSTTLTEDAARRDFTMNALYAQADGQVIDPLDGLPDLWAGRVRFIGDPEARIVEDSLRILRFFRFTCYYGNRDLGIDADGLAACAANVDRLDILSNERIGAEMKKILAAPDPAPVIASMYTAGVLMRLMPGADGQALAPLVHLEELADISPDWLRRLVALGGVDCAKRLNLSRRQAKAMASLKKALASDHGVEQLGFLFGKDVAISADLIQSASQGRLPPENLTEIAGSGQARVFPVTAADLMPEYQGAALGKRLSHLQDKWLASQFMLSKVQLLG